MGKRIRLVLLSGALAGCGGGGSSVDGGGQLGPIDGAQSVGGKRDAAVGSCVALSPAGAKVSWNDNGTSQCAVVVEATRVTNSSQDFLEIIGGTSTGVGLALTVVSYTSALGGTYNCKTDAGATSLYVDFVYTGTTASTVLDCTITITNAGTPGSANAVGSFSATLSTGGGTTTITQGIFDTPVSG